MLAEKFTQDTPLPLPGSVGFLRGSGQRARVQRQVGGSEVLVTLFERIGGRDWQPVAGSTGNTTVKVADLCATEREATKPAKRRRRA